MTDSALLLHAIKGPAASCLMALMLAQSPATARWVSQVTGYAPNTVTQALSLLERFGLASHNGKRSGWRTELRLTRPDSPDPGDGALTIANYDELKLEADSIKLSVVKASGLIAADEKQPAMGSGAPDDAVGSDDRFSLPEGFHASVPRLLEAAEVLFGEPVIAPFGQKFTPRVALAWIANAYAQRHRLRKPARVIHAGLKRGELPEQRYLDDPLAHLPPRYLVAAGLQPPPDELPEPQPLPDEDPESSGEAAPEKPDPALEQPVSAGSSRTARQAWQQALEIARQEAAPALVRGYLLPVRLAGYDADAGVFTLQAGSPQAQEVLQSRLAKPLERWLQGICNRMVRVCFVV